MLDFLSLKKNELACSLCGGIVHGDNCSPKGCSHAFHSDCFETWMGKNGLAEEYVCPAADCTSKFSEITVRKTPFGLTSKVVSLKESHQCPICCEPLQVPVATPESCNHKFCYVCLREWSRVRHECPLDRGAFELILLSDKIGGPITKRVSPPPVQSPPPEDTYEELDTNCEICSSPEDEAHLLLCDHCDRGFHTYCLPVPLTSIPPGDWYCPDCVRHGIGRNSPATRTRTRRSRINSAAADDEAVEHGQNEWNSDLSDDPGDETFHLSHELSNESQERLARRARRRHRGARLLQDTISQLAERVLSEVSQREQRRRDHRRHARTQVTSHARTRNDEPSPRSVCPREHIEIRRRRLFVLSDESSDEEAIGIPLRVPNLKRDFCRRNVQVGQSSNSEVAQEPSAKRSRLDSSEVKTQDAPSVGPSSSGPTETVSQATPSFQQSSCSSGTDGQLNCQPTSSQVYSGTKASTRTPEKTKKKRKLKSKKRVVTRPSNRRLLKLRKRRKKLTKTQRRIRRGILERSSISSPTKSPRNIRSSLRSSSNVLPRLSILGAEPTCSLFVEDTTPDNGSLPGIRNGNHPKDKFRPPAPTLLREIVANQTSMFQFTTRHMHVNSDHSMSPIPVNEVGSTVESVHTSVVQNSSTESRPTSASSSKQQKTAEVLTPSPFVVSETKVNSSHSENIAPEKHVGCKSTAEIQCKSNSPFLQGSEVTTLLTPSTSHNTSGENQRGWDSEKLQYARAILKANLKPSLVSGRIDKPTYEHIFDRAIYKIQQKDAAKVTDARVQKLAKQYIEYCLRHKVVNAD